MPQTVTNPNVRKLRILAKKMQAKASFDTQKKDESWTSMATIVFDDDGTFEAVGTGASKPAAEEIAAKEVCAVVAKAGIISKAITSILLANRMDYTTSLKEICEVLGFGRPDYKMKTRNRERFMAFLTLRKANGDLIASGEGKGKSKSDARCAAAKEVLTKLGLVKS